MQFRENRFLKHKVQDKLISRILDLSEFIRYKESIEISCVKTSGVEIKKDK